MRTNLWLTLPIPDRPPPRTTLVRVAASRLARAVSPLRDVILLQPVTVGDNRQEFRAVSYSENIIIILVGATGTAYTEADI